MDTPDWTQFVRKILLKAPLEKVYACWATQKGLESWFLEKAPFSTSVGAELPPDQLAGTGNQFTWKWYNWEFEESGQVLDANGRDRISFTFADSVVRVALSPNQGMVQLTLTQESIPQDEASRMNVFVGCSNGWTFWLTNLKAWLEHGVLLHQREPLNEKPDGIQWVNM